MVTKGEVKFLRLIGSLCIRHVSSMALDAFRCDALDVPEKAPWVSVAKVTSAESQDGATTQVGFSE